MYKRPFYIYILYRELLLVCPGLSFVSVQYRFSKSPCVLRLELLLNKIQASVRVELIPSHIAVKHNQADTTAQQCWMCHLMITRYFYTLHSIVSFSTMEC